MEIGKSSSETSALSAAFSWMQSAIERRDVGFKHLSPHTQSLLLQHVDALTFSRYFCLVTRLHDTKSH